MAGTRGNVILVVSAMMILFAQTTTAKLLGRKFMLIGFKTLLFDSFNNINKTTLKSYRVRFMRYLGKYAKFLKPQNSKYSHQIKKHT